MNDYEVMVMGCGAPNERCVGARAHGGIDLSYANAPYTLVQCAMHIHATVAEFLPTVLSKLEPFA
jgi:hypothetical protein